MKLIISQQRNTKTVMLEHSNSPAGNRSWKLDYLKHSSVKISLKKLVCFWICDLSLIDWTSKNAQTLIWVLLHHATYINFLVYSKRETHMKPFPQWCLSACRSIFPNSWEQGQGSYPGMSLRKTAGVDRSKNRQCLGQVQLVQFAIGDYTVILQLVLFTLTKTALARSSPHQAFGTTSSLSRCKTCGA